MLTCIADYPISRIGEPLPWEVAARRVPSALLKDRKRHLLVDTQGLLLKAKVLPADLHDRPAAEPVLAGLHRRFPGIRLLWADTAYRGLGDWLAGTLGWSLEITRHWWTGARVWVAAGQPPPERPAGFRVLPRRWVVERTFAWLGQA